MGRAGTILVGLGNPYMRDDFAGIAVARGIQANLGDPDLTYRELSSGGIQLVETLAGFERAVIIDAITTEDGQPGDYYMLDLEGSRTGRRTGFTHEVGLLEGLKLGEIMGLELPRDLRIYAVEVADPYTFDVGMTEAVAAEVPRVVGAILAEEFGMTCPRAPEEKCTKQQSPSP